MFSEAKGRNRDGCNLEILSDGQSDSAKGLRPGAPVHVDVEFSAYSNQEPDVCPPNVARLLG